MLDDGEVDGSDMADELRAYAASDGLQSRSAVQSFERKATDYRPFAAAVAQTGRTA